MNFILVRRKSIYADISLQVVLASKFDKKMHLNLSAALSRTVGNISPLGFVDDWDVKNKEDCGTKDEGSFGNDEADEQFRVDEDVGKIEEYVDADVVVDDVKVEVKGDKDENAVEISGDNEVVVEVFPEGEVIDVVNMGNVADVMGNTIDVGIGVKSSVRLVGVRRFIAEVTDEEVEDDEMGGIGGSILDEDEVSFNVEVKDAEEEDVFEFSEGGVEILVFSLEPVGFLLFWVRGERIILGLLRETDRVIWLVRTESIFFGVLLVGTLLTLLDLGVSSDGVDIKISVFSCSLILATASVKWSIFCCIETTSVIRESVEVWFILFDFILF